MSRMRLVAGVLGVLLLAGCGAAAPAAAPPAPAVTPLPAPNTVTTPPVAPPNGGVAITGAVKSIGVLTKEDIAGLPQQTVEVTFASSKGAEKHTETGVRLAEVLSPTALATTDRKNDLLSFAVLAIGADGYAATVSYGEISADFGNRGLLVALTEDGKPLARPRLVVPGDVKGGRYVSDLVELRVFRLAP